MHRFIIISAAAAMVLSGAGFGQEPPATTRLSGNGTKESVWEVFMSTPENSQPYGKIETARGPVLSIEKDLARFTILLPDKRPLVIQMEMKTSLRLAGHEVEIWDLRLGDRVAVAYRVEEGRNIARTITVER